MDATMPMAVPKAGPTPLAELTAFLTPFAPLFRRAQSRQSLERYVTGLLTDLPRKNCDTIVAAVAGTSTERLQHLLTDADWEPDALDEARVRQVVALSPPGGVLVLDDTGRPKKGHPPSRAVDLVAGQRCSRRALAGRGQDAPVGHRGGRASEGRR